MTSWFMTQAFEFSSATLQYCITAMPPPAAKTEARGTKKARGAGATPLKTTDQDTSSSAFMAACQVWHPPLLRLR